MASRGFRSGAKARARRRLDAEGVLASPRAGRAPSGRARGGMLMRWQTLCNGSFELGGRQLAFPRKAW